MGVLFSTSDGKINTIGTTYTGIPVGSIIPFMGKVVPVGWLLCDGSTFDKDKYFELYNVLDSDTLPDLRDKTVFGAGDKQLGTATEGGIPNIIGVLSAAGAYVFQPNIKDGAFNTSGYGDYAWPYSAGRGSHLAYFSAKNGEAKTDGTLKSDDDYHVYGQTDYVEPASIIVNFIIRAI